jgi:hypothetical protein
MEEAEAREPLGPLVSHNLHPLYAPFIQLPPLSAETVGANGIAVFLHESYGNNYIFDPEDPDDGGDEDIFAILDSEASYTTMGLTWGIHPRAEVNASILLVIHYGGVFDAALEGYHNLFGFPNAGRERRDRNEARYYFENENGIVIDESGAVIDMTALMLEPRIELYQSPDDRFLLSAGPAVKLPLAAPSIALTNGGTDIAVRLFADYRWPVAAVSGSLGVGFLSLPDYVPEESFRPWILPFFASFEWMLADSFSIVTTISGTTSPFELGYRRTDRFSAIANMGGVFALSDQLRLKLGLGQEFFTFAATDVGVHLALHYRFDEQWEPRR